MVQALLVVAVLSGVLGSTSLKLSLGLRRPWAVVGTVLGYGVAIVAMGLLMEHLAVGVIYAVWGGGAAALMAVVGRVVFHERLTPERVAGTALIVVGVVVLNLAGTL